MTVSASTLPRLALSVRQPWAWAIVEDHKRIENRDWRNRPMGLGKDCLNHRGPTAIHASKMMTRQEYETAAAFMAELGVVCPAPASLPRGGIVGTADVVGVVKQSDDPWFFGPKGIVLANARSCEFIPAAGELFYFAWHPAPAGYELPKPARWMLRNYAAPEKVASGPSLIDLLQAG